MTVLSALINARRFNTFRGRALELCPICHDIRVFEVSDLDTQAQAFFFPISKVVTSDQLLVCEGCGLRVSRTVFPISSVHHVQGREALWEMLSPAAQESLRDRVHEEMELLRNPRGVDAARRRSALQRPFLMCEVELHSRLSSGRIHPPHRLREEALFLIAWPSGIVATLLSVAPPLAFYCVMAEFAVGLLYLSWRAWRQRSPIFVQEVLVPRLVRALAPLRPDESELESLGAYLYQKGVRCAHPRVIVAIRRRLEFEQHVGSFP